MVVHNKQDRVHINVHQWPEAGEDQIESKMGKGNKPQSSLYSTMTLAPDDVMWNSKLRIQHPGGITASTGCV